MLNIHTGRENLDKDKFMFESISGQLKEGRSVILIVPDQFTLQAEKNAFAYLDVKGLMSLEVLSFSRLANRVFSEVGGGLKSFVNNYGKYMMISRILLNENPNFKVFKNLEGSSDFIEKMNNFISEIKNHNLTPEQLNSIIEKEDGDSLLSRKLEDIERVYRIYEQKMGSEHIDTADYLGMFISKINESRLVSESEFWLSGFDYLTPRNMDAVLEIAEASGSMNVVLTAEQENSFFKSTNTLASDLRIMAIDRGMDSKIIPIDSRYKRIGDGKNVLSHLEEQFCATSPKAYNSDEDKDNIELVAAANYYAEAETAAANITQLIRDKGFRYRDILVICNDMDARASVIKRVFSEYGLPVFIDQRRGIHHNPVLEYITALLDIAGEGWQPGLIFKFLKTGLTQLTPDEIEEIENYSIKFKITGGKWKREFTLAFDGYNEEDLTMLNQAREKVCNIITGFEKEFKNAGTAKERTSQLYKYLTEDANLPVKISEYIGALERDGKLEYAEEMSQVWKTIIGIFDQLVNVLGDEEVTDEEFATILKTGFESVQMGMLPPSTDQILLGTMQRTRTGKVKALFVLGANDGVLPAYSGEETLLNEDERDVLYEKGNIICRNDEQIMREEQMAIYRNLSKPENYLFMSYSVSDTEGSELNPSIIFQRVHRLFPGINIEKDILNRRESDINLVQGQASTVNHLTDVMRDWISTDFIPELWEGVYRWFEENNNKVINRIAEGLSFRNINDNIDEKFVVDLYKRANTDEQDLIQSSPSGLESFSRCPFSFFMGRGIRLKERRVYELDGRDIGDVYHETLMKFGEAMCDDGLKPLDEKSKWNTMTEDQCQALISEIYDHIEDKYKEGLFKESRYEEYRGNRFKKIISNVALEIKRQINEGRIEKMFFETEFKDGGDFEPIIVKKEGKTVEITGKVDRLDVLSGGYAKIVDYKSGSDKLVREDIESGWQLQLMVYMKAVSESDKSLKPAGVFYFNIPEPHVSTNGLTEDEIKAEVKKEMTKNYRMDGMVINDESVLRSIKGEKTAGIMGNAAIEEEDFSAMESTVTDIVESLCEDMISGSVRAKPKVSKQKDSNSKEITACTYCQYRGICGYDSSFDR